ncbi:MAG: DUF1553 domain-containing protein [Verrucomicrobiales bacterium]|nr:DUF1553 domain-containing protein [Verrucomicrobiales bacterium]
MRPLLALPALLAWAACPGTGSFAVEATNVASTQPPAPATTQATDHYGGTNTRPWAFQVPVKHPLPGVADTSWPRQPLDHFVLAGLEQRKLRPVRRATKSEWIRRATFDLLGLPPTSEECQAFDKDTGPGAFAKVVNRLLDSPHYGERWGRYWLDVARYADDQGNSFLTPTPAAYLYRDWVVQAFNDDMPYDEFMRLQIAGDEIPGPAVDYVARLAGLGFQGLGPIFRKGAAGEAKAKADELEDRIDTLSRGILGLTVSCARCHDHKFDPIPTRDYYSLAAAYNGADWPSRMLAAPEVVETHRKWAEELERQKADLKKWREEQARSLGRQALPKTDAYALAACQVLVLRAQKLPFDEAAFARQAGLELHFLNRWIQTLDQPPGDSPLAGVRTAAQQARDLGSVAISASLRQQVEALRNQVLAALHASAASEVPSTNAPGKATTPGQDKLLAALWKDTKAPFFVEEKDRDGLIDEPRKKESSERQARIDALAKSPPPSGPLMPSVHGGGQPMRVFVRGNPENPGEEAPPGFLRALNGHATGTTPSEKPFTRLELANAIANPNNPLTARVIVNRVWHYHFGRGIVATPSNFGQLGSPPTHPELLDTLAVQFMEAGWSIKWLHREIMLSSTYLAASVPDPANMAIDPGNEYLWRVSPRRLDFEAWRDTLLSVAGLLDPRVGGPSVDQTNPGLKEVEGFNFFSRLNGIEADNPAGRRRTLYSVVSRYAPNTTMMLFDFPEPNVTSDQRISTTVPQQQLFVLNSPFFVEMSRGLAKRLANAAATDDERIGLGWHLAYGRSPSDEERDLAKNFLAAKAETDSAGTDADRLTRWEQLSHAWLASNEFMFVP